MLEEINAFLDIEFYLGIKLMCPPRLHTVFIYLKATSIMAA